MSGSRKFPTILASSNYSSQKPEEEKHSVLLKTEKDIDPIKKDIDPITSVDAQRRVAYIGADIIYPWSGYYFTIGTLHNAPPDSTLEQEAVKIYMDKEKVKRSWDRTQTLPDVHKHQIVKYPRRSSLPNLQIPLPTSSEPEILSTPRPRASSLPSTPLPGSEPLNQFVIKPISTLVKDDQENEDKDEDSEEKVGTPPIPKQTINQMLGIKPKGTWYQELTSTKKFLLWFAVGICVAALVYSVVGMIFCAAAGASLAGFLTLAGASTGTEVATALNIGAAEGLVINYTHRYLNKRGISGKPLAKEQNSKKNQTPERNTKKSKDNSNEEYRKMLIKNGESPQKRNYRR